MQLVDEQDDTGALICGLFDLVEDRLDTFLVLATMRCTSHERTHVEGVESANEGCGYVAVDDSLCEALRDGGLTDTGFTNEHWVVLRSVGGKSVYRRQRYKCRVELTFGKEYERPDESRCLGR